MCFAVVRGVAWPRTASDAREHIWRGILSKQNAFAADKRHDFLAQWLLDELRRIAWGADSVSTAVYLGEKLEFVRVEDKEAAIWSVYLELIAAFPSHPDYGLDREFGVPSRRAVRRLARDRLHDRLVDQHRRRLAKTHDPHVGARSNLVHLEAPCHEGEEPLFWYDKVADHRAGTPHQAEARSVFEALTAETDGAGQLIALAPELGIDDEEIGDCINRERDAVRQRRARTWRRVRRRLGEGY
jgi:hypothetical protein